MAAKQSRGGYTVKVGGKRRRATGVGAVVAAPPKQGTPTVAYGSPLQPGSRAGTIVSR
jgi:hypothetical protein